MDIFELSSKEAKMVGWTIWKSLCKRRFYGRYNGRTLSKYNLPEYLGGDCNIDFLHLNDNIDNQP